MNLYMAMCAIMQQHPAFPLLELWVPTSADLAVALDA